MSGSSKNLKIRNVWNIINAHHKGYSYSDQYLWMDLSEFKNNFKVKLFKKVNESFFESQKSIIKNQYQKFFTFHQSNNYKIFFETETFLRSTFFYFFFFYKSTLHL
jgi:hypothetical protein